MGGILGGTKTVSTTDPRVSTYQVTQSSYGSPLPIVFGTTRVPGVMLDYADFTAIAHTTTQHSGGKGGGGVDSSQTSWTYTVAAAICVGEGPCTTIGKIWKGDKISDLGSEQLTFFNGAVGQAPWGYMQSKHPERAIGYSGVAYVAGVINLGSNSSLPNYNFELFGLCQNRQGVPSTSLAQQYAFQKTISISNWVADNGVFEYVFGQGWVQVNPIYYTLAQTQDGLGNPIAGSYTYTFNFDDRKDGNDRADPLNILIKYTATPGSVQYTANDANPADTIMQLLVNPVFGAQFPASYVFDLTDYKNYCNSMGLLLSDAFNSQKQASDIISNILEATNSELVWSQGKVKVIPYYDGLIPIYDITDNNILDQGDNSIVITRNSQADVFNVVPLEYLDRANDYNTDTVYATDLGDISLHGIRQASTYSHHHITNKAAAQLSAQMILQKQLYVRNQYVVKVGQEYVLLEAMDPVDLACQSVGLDRTALRVVSVKESKDDYSLEITLEDNPTGSLSAPSYQVQTATRTTVNTSVDPGCVNQPVIFELPDNIASDGMKIAIAASGKSPYWGGCSVWVSQDQITYKKIGTLNAPARQGVLTTGLTAQPDPDTTDLLGIDLTMSNGQLSSGSKADADSFNTLCYCDGELISYQNATLTAPGHYNLSYLRRGVYGTKTQAHATGTQFLRLDQGAYLTYPFTQANLGQTVYIKLTSFNVFGGGEQSQASVQPYTYTIRGSALFGPLPQVQNVRISYSNSNAVLNWDYISDFRSPIIYEIRKGATFANAVAIARVDGCSYQIPGNDTYWIAAVYQTIYNGQPYVAYSAAWDSIAVTNCTVPKNLVASFDEFAGDLKGAVGGNCRVNNGVITLFAPNDFDSMADIDQVLPTIDLAGMAVCSGTYTIAAGNILTLSGPQIVNVNCTTAFEGLPQANDFDSTPDVDQLLDWDGNQPQYVSCIVQINTSMDGTTWQGWQNFIPGQYFGKAFNFRAQLATANEQYMPIMTAFAVAIDVQDVVQTGYATTGADGKFSITYPTPYNMAPLPQLTIVNQQPGDSITITAQTATGAAGVITDNNGKPAVRQYNWMSKGY